LKNITQARTALPRMTPQETKLTIGFGSLRPMKVWNRKPKAGISGISQTIQGFVPGAADSAACAPCS